MILGVCRRSLDFRGKASARGVGLVVATTLAAMVLAAAGLRLIEPEYVAVATVGPTARSGGAGVGLRLPDTGRDASLAMAELGPADEVLSDFSRYLELLRGLPVAEMLIAEPNFARGVFSDSWDEASQSWRPSDGVWAKGKRAFLALVGRPAWSAPDAVALRDRLRRRVVVEPVGTGPMRRIVFRHADRTFALEALRRLLAAADAHLKIEAARRAQAQIDHIRARLGGAASTQHSAALGRLLADQEAILLALMVDLPFAADVIETPHAAAAPDWPDALTVVAVAGLSGFSVAAFFVGRARAGWRNDPPTGAAAQ